MQFRPAPLVLVALVVLGAVTAVGPATAAGARLTLTDTTVTPATPTVGAPITAETTLRLSAGSNTSMTVDEVRVVERNDSDEQYGTATDLGTLSPGETLDVPVTFSVDEAGAYDLQLVAVGTDAEGDSVRATRPLAIGVERGEPQVELDTDEYVAGAETQLQATVSNPTTAAIRDIDISVTDPRQDAGASIPTLAAGASQTVNLSVSAPESGNRTLELTTNYTTPNGVELTSTTTREVDVASLQTDIGLRVQAAGSDDSQQQGAGDLTGLLGGGGAGALQQQSGEEDTSSGSQIDVTVTNFGNAPVENVVLTGEDSEGARLSAIGRFAAADRLAPGESTTVTVDLSRVRTSDDIRFVASYEAPEGDDESTLVYGYNAQLGEAALTGVDVTVREGGRVLLSGNLANTGDGEVTSAVVSVQPTDGVQPAYPQRNYFVGTVDGSSFAPFELTGQADLDNATAVTVQIAYSVEGESVTDTVSVPLPPQTDEGSGSSLGLLAALTLGLVAIVGVGLYARRSPEGWQAFTDRIRHRLDR